jgi:tRNA G18 (ribose-2'-O)-methylase SpoU
MNTNNYLPVFIEQCDFAKQLSTDNIKYIITGDKIPCFIFGNEHYGIPPNILNLKDRFSKCHAIELNQMGSLRSFNVSASAAIVLYKVMEVYSSLTST